MKKVITIICITMAFYMNAQLIVDDFTTGNLNNTIFDLGESGALFQTGNSIIGKSRRIHVNVRKNPFEQDIKVAVKSNLLAISASYDTRGTVYVGYGKDKTDRAAPMNLNLSKYKSLKIEFEGKSTINGIYVSMFTGTSRAVYSKHVAAREGVLVFTIPLKDFEKIGANYTIKDIDQIRFQFDSRSKTGCNMAINKIWFE